MKKCFECGATEDLQEHHVVPRFRGGTKTIPLCYSCHCKAHGRDSKGLEHARLTKEALARAKTRGVKLGASNPAIKEASQRGTRAKGARTIARLTPMFHEVRSEGFTTGQAMADALNDRGVQSASGRPWSRFTALSMWKTIQDCISSEEQ
jgi:hypothetical protein